MERLTVTEAASRLGIGQDAVRNRIQRGTIPHTRKPDGTVYVYLDTNTEDASRKSGLESNDELTLHYIDKLYSSWQSASGSAKRIGVVFVILCLLLLILSGGGASAEQKLTLSGIGLKVPFVVFLTAGAVGIVVLINSFLAIDRTQALLEKDIIRLYKKIGFDDYTLVGSDSDWPGPFETGNPVMSFGAAFRGAGFAVIAGIYVTLPVAAQVATGFKVSELLQNQGFGGAWIFFIS